jgi:acetyl esterase/lipase
MMDAQGGPPLEEQDPIEARLSRIEPFKMLGGQPDQLDRVENLSVPRLSGEVPIRLYASEQGGVRPALIYFHGGGYVLGNLDTHDAVCRALAKESGAVVIAVDYRLSPESKFPAAVEDAYAATVWTAANAGRLGINSRRIAVGGDSAGAALATVVAKRCRDAGGPALAAQVLFYPVTDMSSFETGSYRELGEGYFLTRSSMQWFTGLYLASADDARNPEVSPLLAPDLSGLPPALVITAEFDPLRDEGEAYAQRLQQAGVPVTVTRYPGMIHAFISMRGVITDGRKGIQQAAMFIQSIA